MGYVVWLMSVGGWAWTVAFLAAASIPEFRGRSRPNVDEIPLDPQEP